jgi:catechol 2,3-dioxygenase-like lactoylglutathione lyase family enzyme
LRTNALVPELAVSDWRRSRTFYCDVIGFQVAYERPEEGLSFLTLGDAQLMIDQIGIGRTFDIKDAPLARPFGRGLNLQILVPQVAPILKQLEKCRGTAPSAA